MKSNVTTSQTKVLLIAMLLTVIGFAMPVRAQAASGSRSPSASQNVSEIKDLQSALSFAEFQKNRADAFERSAALWKQQSDDNFKLYESEHRRAETLLSANQDRQQVDVKTNQAVGLLTSLEKDDHDRINELGDKLSRCEAAKWKWGLAGGAIGFGTGAAFSHR